MPFHLSAAAVANLTDRLCCSARRTLTAKRPASQKLSKLGVSLSRQNRISGGSSETEEKELMVMPRLRPERSRSEEHTSELQSLMRISYAGFCLKKNNSRRNRSTNQQ